MGNPQPEDYPDWFLILVGILVIAGFIYFPYRFINWIKIKGL